MCLQKLGGNKSILLLHIVNVLSYLFISSIFDYNGNIDHRVEDCVVGIQHSFWNGGSIFYPQKGEKDLTKCKMSQLIPNFLTKILQLQSPVFRQKKRAKNNADTAILCKSSWVKLWLSWLTCHSQINICHLTQKKNLSFNFSL